LPWGDGWTHGCGAQPETRGGGEKKKKEATNGGGGETRKNTRWASLFDNPPQTHREKKGVIWAHGGTGTPPWQDKEKEKKRVTR